MKSEEIEEIRHVMKDERVWILEDRETIEKGKHKKVSWETMKMSQEGHDGFILKHAGKI